MIRIILIVLTVIAVALIYRGMTRSNRGQLAGGLVMLVFFGGVIGVLLWLDREQPETALLPPLPANQRNALIAEASALQSRINPTAFDDMHKCMRYLQQLDSFLLRHRQLFPERYKTVQRLTSQRNKLLEQQPGLGSGYCREDQAMYRFIADTQAWLKRLGALRPAS
jgi:hypothetical protein